MELLIEKMKILAEELICADPRNRAYIKVENTDIKINFYEFLSFYADWLLNKQSQKKIKKMICVEIADKIPPFLNKTKKEIEASKLSLGYNDEEFTRTFFHLLNVETVADNIDQKINIICLNEILDRIAEEKEEWKREVCSLYINYN